MAKKAAGMCDVAWCVSRAVEGETLCAAHRRSPKFAPALVKAGALEAVWKRVPSEMRAQRRTKTRPTSNGG